MKRFCATAVFFAAMLSGCGSVIRREFLDNGARDFDFRAPNCSTDATARSAPIEVRYLGSGGFSIRWGGDALLLGPYFSNAGGLWRAQFGRLAFDERRIAGGMRNIDAERVLAVALGHSHFDHIGDLPILLRDYIGGATVYTNREGGAMLAAYAATLHPRVVAVEPLVNQWISVRRKDGTASSIRLMPLSSDHAPQLCSRRSWPCTYAACELHQPWTTPWTAHRMRRLCGGGTFAYLIDLLNPNGSVAFRLYYNDAAPGTDLTLPLSVATEHAVDVAIICMASYDLVEKYPERLLATLKPRHIVISHYEDFFAKSDGSWSFVPLMSNRKANRFMARLKAATEGDSIAWKPPINAVCGPMTRRWSMPVPQSALYFNP